MKQQHNIDLSKTSEVFCYKCGNPLFHQVFRTRTLSTILSPTGKQEIFMIPTLICTVCNEEKILGQTTIPGEKQNERNP